jgi:hypothetical protein
MKSPWTPSRSTFALVAVSTAIVILASLGLATVASTYAARDQFAETAAIRNAALFPDESPTVRARPLAVSADSRTVRAIVAEPVTEDASPPFGLTEWPAPGQFLLSGDLIDSKDSLGARFGQFAGVLPDDELPSADSRVMLARPSQPLGDEWLASGFGVTGPLQDVAIESSGFFLDDRISKPAAFGGVALAGFVPALVLLATVLGNSGRRTANMSRTLEVLGVTPGKLHLARLRAHVPALLSGFAIATGGFLLATFFDIRLPLADFTVRALDVRLNLPYYVGALAAGAMCCLVVALLSLRPGPLAAANRPRARATWRGRGWLAVVGLAVVLITSQIAVAETAAAAAAGMDRGAILWVIAGSLIAIAFMPALVGELITATARAVSQSGIRKGHAARLIVGRDLEASRLAVRVAATGATLIVVTGLASTWALMGAAPAVQAQRVIDQIDGRFVQVAPPSDVQGEPANSVLAHLPEGAAVLTLHEEGHEKSDGVVEFQATLSAEPTELDHWGLKPGETHSAQDLPRMLDTVVSSGPETQVRITDDMSAGTNDGDYTRTAFVVFNLGGERVDRDAIQSALSAAGGPGWSVYVGGESWIIGANDLAHEFRWIGWFATIGASLLVAALWLRAIEDQKHQISAAISLDALFATRPILPKIVSGRVLILAAAILVVGGGTAAMFARVTSGSLSTTGGSLPVVATSCVAVVTTLFVLSAPIAFTLMRNSRSWTPGGAHDNS